MCTVLFQCDVICEKTTRGNYINWKKRIENVKYRQVCTSECSDRQTTRWREITSAWSKRWDRAPLYIPRLYLGIEHSISSFFSSIFSSFLMKQQCMSFFRKGAAAIKGLPNGQDDPAGRRLGSDTFISNHHNLRRPTIAVQILGYHSHLFHKNQSCQKGSALYKSRSWTYQADLLKTKYYSLTPRWEIANGTRSYFTS